MMNRTTTPPTAEIRGELAERLDALADKLPPVEAQPTPEHVPCRDCGLPVEHPASVEQLGYGGGRVEVAPGVYSQTATAPAWQTPVATCPACQQRRQLAARLRAAHASYARHYSTEQLDAALLVAEALRMSPAEVERITATARDLRLLTIHLGPVASLARWSAQLDPRSKAAATFGPGRFDTITQHARRQLRDAGTALLRQRLERVGPQRPPAGDACMLCGVGAVLTYPSDAAAAWGREQTARLGTLGDGAATQRRGYLCPVCREAVESNGWGVSAATRSLCRSLGVAFRAGQSVEATNVTAWASLPAGTRPNTTPWAHLGDLAEIAAELRRYAPATTIRALDRRRVDLSGAVRL